MQPQINPPFDGLKPCPACQRAVAGRASYLHNFLNRCAIGADSGNIAQGKAWVKLNDLKNSIAAETGPVVELTVPHPAGQEILDVTADLMVALAGLEDRGAKVVWTEDTPAKVNALIPRIALAVDAWAPLSDAHFEDERHYRPGGHNILCQKQGSSFPGHHPSNKKRDTSYAYTVETFAAADSEDMEGDLTHTVCGTKFILHAYFLRHLSADPLFYALVYCPTCQGNLPIAQFKIAGE